MSYAIFWHFTTGWSGHTWAWCPLAHAQSLDWNRSKLFDLGKVRLFTILEVWKDDYTISVHVVSLNILPDVSSRCFSYFSRSNQLKTSFFSLLYCSIFARSTLKHHRSHIFGPSMELPGTKIKCQGTFMIVWRPFVDTAVFWLQKLLFLAVQIWSFLSCRIIHSKWLNII